MKTRVILSVAAAGLLAACGDSSDSSNPPAGPTGKIALRGSTTFNGPHAGQALQAALVRASDGATLDVQRSTVAATGTDPAFLVTFAPTVDLGVAYKIRYWVDHNGNGSCDAPPTDHQWETDAPSGQALVAVNHSTAFTSVCSTFPRIALRGTTTFNGPHAGQTFRAALVRWSDDATLEVQKSTVAATGVDPAFLVTFARAIDTSVPYKIRYWVDHNSNDACDPPPTDHQWEADAAAGQTLVTVSHNVTFVNACGSLTFPLTFRGTTTFNGPHAGNAYQAALVKGGATTPLEVRSGTVAAAGTDPAFLVSFAPRLFFGESYSVKLWMDFNASGTCDAPPTDHQWSVPIGTDPSNVQTTVGYAHNTTFTNVCSFVPVTPTGRIALRGSTTFNGPHAGQPLRAALVRASDDVTLEIQKGAVAATGIDPAFLVTFAPVPIDVPYKIRYWVDHNGNGSCDAPPTDHQWETDAPAGQTLVAVNHSTTFTPVCSTLTFPLTFSGTTSFNGPHAGNAFKAALVAGSATAALVVQSGTVAATGTSPAFSVTFPQLFIGDPYSVKLWMDLNSSGSCDAPPTDHQWTVDIDTALASRQTNVSYVHNTAFTNVCTFVP